MDLRAGLCRIGSRRVEAAEAGKGPDLPEARRQRDRLHQLINRAPDTRRHRVLPPEEFGRADDEIRPLVIVASIRDEREPLLPVNSAVINRFGGLSVLISPSSVDNLLREFLSHFSALTSDITQKDLENLVEGNVPFSGGINRVDREFEGPGGTESLFDRLVLVMVAARGNVQSRGQLWVVDVAGSALDDQRDLLAGTGGTMFPGLSTGAGHSDGFRCPGHGQAVEASGRFTGPAPDLQ